MTYSTESSFLSLPLGTQQVWADAIRPHNAAQADAIGVAYFHFGEEIGLNADLALAQACHESAWFTSPHWTAQFDPCGLGVTSDATPGATFASLEAGVQAHYEHLVCYTMTANPPAIAEWGMLDPRHDFHDGLPRVSDLVRPERKWAVPGDGYAAAIVAMANQVIGDGGTMTQQPTIIDIRDQLPTNPNGGSGQVNAAKRGVVLHYSAVDYPEDRDIIGILQSEAAFHIGPYLGEAGLAYHYTVDWRDGRVYQCRDDDAVLWHCASWSTPGNGDGVAVHVPGGPNLVMRDAAVRGLLQLFAHLQVRYGFGREMIFGHKEVAAPGYGTACPGPLMDQIIYPYRAGTVHLEGGINVTTEAEYFKETGHGIGGGFLQYWRQNGGLMQFGLPLTDEVQESGVTTQYFERAVFEFHPENQGPYRVLLRRVGVVAAKAAGYAGVGIN